MERRYEEDGEARAAARAAAQEDLFMNHMPNERELPTALEADLDASHDAGVLSVQCIPGVDAVITGSGEHSHTAHLLVSQMEDASQDTLPCQCHVQVIRRCRGSILTTT